MALFASLVVAVAGVMVGDVWPWVAETYRIGNHHISYRAGRLPWAQHSRTSGASDRADRDTRRTPPQRYVSGQWTAARRSINGRFVSCCMTATGDRKRTRLNSS